MTQEKDEILKRLAYLESEMELLKKQQAMLLEKDKVQPITKIKKKQEEIRNIPPEATPKKEIEKFQPLPGVNETPQVVKKEFDLERVLSKWLPKVFMFILLLGVLWGLKVAADHGYFTNMLRVATGYVGTGLLYYFGMRFYHKQNKVFGYTLLGGFIALGILTTFAAHHLYGYFTFSIAFIIGVAYIIAGLWLAEKTKSEVLALFSAIGGFLLPFLLEGESVTVYGFCAYLLVLFLSLFYISLKQQHKYTFYITFLLFHFTLLAYLAKVGLLADHQAIVVTVFIQHLVLLFIYFTKRISRHVFTEALIYTNFVFTLGWIKLLNDSLENLVYGGFALFYVILTILSFVKKEKLLSGVLSAVSVFAISAYILSFSYEEGMVTLLLLLINGTLSIWIGFRFKTIRTVITGGFIYFLSATTTLLLIDIPSLFSIEHGIWIVFLYSIVLIFYSIYEYPPAFLKGKLTGVDASLIIGQVIALIYLLHLTSLAVQRLSFYTQTTTHIYILVLLVAFGFMYLLHKWSRGIYVVHATIIEFFLLGFIVLFSGLSSNLDRNILFNVTVEVVYLALLTMIFLGIMRNRFYLQSEKLKKHLSIVALGLQIITFIFLNKWYLAIAMFYELELEYLLLVHTFILFAFSFVSISIGRKFNWKPVKYFGALLILFCIFKLFFVDLGAISILIRAILFIIVGVVGLLYSRTLFKEE